METSSAPGGHLPTHTANSEPLNHPPSSASTNSPLQRPATSPSRFEWRRLVLPGCLLIATCASTFFTGAMHWMPSTYWGQSAKLGLALQQNWRSGLIYMLAVMGILLAHEMGHFLVAVRYRIPATYPLFIPLPITPIGTMGAIIGLDGLKANRREMFDLGLSGPVAGLAVALPVLWIGIQRLDFSQPTGFVGFHPPLVGQWMMAWLHPERPADTLVGIGQVNPYFMAGWVGMLITGLNMLPVGQLDGGHVAYALFGRRAHLLARAFLIAAIGAVVIWEVYIWTIMLLLVTLMGVDHPPTRNDHMSLGRWRWLAGIASLAIPVLCFTPLGIGDF